jgi:hypothetical protein
MNMYLKHSATYIVADPFANIGTVGISVYLRDLKIELWDINLYVSYYAYTVRLQVLALGI